MKQIYVSFFASVIVRDHRVARTESAERFTEGEMKIERPTRCLVVARCSDCVQPLVGTRRIGPERDGRIAGIAGSRDVVLGKKISHCITSLTVLTRSLTLSSGVPGKTP